MASRASTLSDVATAAGVSLATASRALNGSERVVREDLRARVLDAAQRLGYTPNAQAQAMARGATDVVGLIVNDIADPYFSTIAAGLAAAAEEQGLLVMLCSTAGRQERELEFLTALHRQRGRAIVLAGSRTTARRHQQDVTRQLGAFTQGGGRVVAISQPKLPVDTVVVDNHGGAEALARELHALGYRHPALLSGPSELLVSRDRQAGFVAGWKAAGGSEPTCVTGAFNRDGGYDAMLGLFERRADFDCVFAANDLMAMGAIAACRALGVGVPGDLGVAGFDDITTLRDVVPALTTVRLPLEEMGRTALQLVLSGPAAKPRRHSITGEVVVRESTPPR